METLDEIISLLRIVIIPLGTIFRVVFCFIKMSYDEDATNSYKKKIWNTIAFLIISELIFVVVDLIKVYYGDYLIPSISQPFSNGGGAGGGGGSAGGR